MMHAARKPSAIPVVFGAEEWQEEVERYPPSAIPRARAQSARRAIEAGSARLDWRRCRAEDDPRGIRLPRCLKLRVPLDEAGASAAPYGFVFQFQRAADNSPMLNFVAFGERHPDNERTQSVYVRAHKRLHGHYP
jgi:hypothetical protein